MTEDRLIALEEKLAYQEHTIHELNDALVGQQQRIDRLEARCQSLQQRLASLAERMDDAGDATTEPPPPHY
ncbi:SlyX family protein [Ectothiorhodospiraceae bacterium WFHF3C12]|nr:SlyX family protein [Ectothiorhodospiraceae bacterium WFHF3C12]